MKDNSKKIDCSIVASVYNEEECLPLFYEAITKVLLSLQINYEIIFVNDGSVDCSLAILKEIAASDSSVRIVDFSRNFGQEAAMLAGIDHARGEAVICMDSDLQHPPEKIPEMLQKKAEGFDVINMVRTDREDESFFRNFITKMFYKFLNSISPINLAANTPCFLLVSSKAANVLRKDFRERTRYLRGIIQLLGFRKTTVDFIAPTRVAGQSKYSFVKLFKLSLAAISSFSKFPLQLGIITGLTFGLLCIALIIFSVVMLTLGKSLPCYTTLLIIMSAFAGIQLFVTGLIGQYIGFVFDEVKGRPVYIVNDVFGFENNKNENVCI